MCYGMARHYDQHSDGSKAVSYTHLRFSQRGVDKENKVVGEFCYTGVQPICLKRFEEYGIPYDSRTLNELSLLPSLW